MEILNFQEFFIHWEAFEEYQPLSKNTYCVQLCKQSNMNRSYDEGLKFYALNVNAMHIKWVKLNPYQKNRSIWPFLCNQQMCDAISTITNFFSHLLMLIVSQFPSSRILLRCCQIIFLQQENKSFFTTILCFIHVNTCEHPSLNFLFYNFPFFVNTPTPVLSFSLKVC